MQYEERIESVPLEDILEPQSSQAALERGAARRRQGRAGRRSVPHKLVENPTVSRPSLHALSEPRARLEPARDKVNESLWRARLESELRSLRAALAGLEANVADDREAIRAAGEQASLHDAERWLDQLARIESRLDRAEGQLSEALQPVRGAAEEQRTDTARLTEYDQRIAAIEQRLGDLAEAHAEAAEALAVVSQSFVARRLRTTSLSMGGIALALISAAVWLFTKGPSVF